MSDQRHPVRTIGHSTHSMDVFLGLLQQHSVTAVADVRSAPFSRFNPQFNKDALEGSLNSHGIKYVFLGRELGARSDDPACYENGRVQYVRLAQTELFKSGLERVMSGSREHIVGLMCAEKEPLECHRTLLVARALVEHDITVDHILADGKLEPHEATLERLLDLHGLPNEDLFLDQEQRVAEALARQEERVAYVDKKPATEAEEDTQ